MQNLELKISFWWIWWNWDWAPLLLKCPSILEYIWTDFTAWKVSKYGVISGSPFAVFKLNTDIYSINLHIQSEHSKIRTRNNSVFGHFLRSAFNLRLFIFNSWNLRDDLWVICSHNKYECQCCNLTFWALTQSGERNI